MLYNEDTQLDITMYPIEFIDTIPSIEVYINSNMTVNVIR